MVWERKCSPLFRLPKRLTIDLDVQLRSGIELLNDFHVYV
jgi:hypothetical protein